MENKTVRAELLQNALDAVNALSEKRRRYAEEVKRFRDSEHRFDTLKKKIEAEKESKIRTRRAALETEYEKLLRAAEDKISEAEKRRKNARTGAMKERILNKTEAPRASIAASRGEIRRLLREEQLPGFCGTPFFMFMFLPQGFLDILKMIAVFTGLLVVLPVFVILLITAVWAKVLVFVLIDLAFIGLYVLIYCKTVMKKPRVLNECREILKKIRAEKKEILGITRKIRQDPDDSCYNLNAYDAELTRLNQEKNDIVLKKQEAQTEFENVEAPQIRAEVDAAGAEELEKAQQEFRSSSEAAKRLAETIAAEERNLDETYRAEIGEKNLTPEGIAKLIEEEKTMQRTDPEGPAPETKG